MTVVLDLPPHLAGLVEADARAQGRPVADLLRDAVADLYDTDETDEDDPEDRDMSELPPLPAILTEPLSESLRKGFEAADAGRVVPGETVLAELRRRVGRV